MEADNPVMDMTQDILDALEDLKWKPDLDETTVQKILTDWNSFSEVAKWITDEMKATFQLDEEISPVKDPADISSFKIELTSMLNELKFPYSGVLETSLAERFETIGDKSIILNFLLSELQASRIAYVQNPKQLKFELDESKPARLLKETMLSLQIGKPPENVKTDDLFHTIYKRIPKDTIPPMFTRTLSTEEWANLASLCADMVAEFKMRREMLLTRLDVTKQSFGWSDRLISKKGDLSKIYSDFKQNISPNPAVNISDILVARSDLPIEEKSSSASVRQNTKSAVHKVSIGRVPDRGGRPDEVEPPPPEMPSWQQRQTSGSSRGGGRGGGGGDNRGGGRGRGSGSSGWIQNPAQSHSQNVHHGNQRGRVQGNWADRGRNQDYSRNQNQDNYYQNQSSNNSYYAHDDRSNQSSYGHQQQGYQSHGWQQKDHQDYYGNNSRNDYHSNSKGGRGRGGSNYGHHSGGRGRNYY